MQNVCVQTPFVNNVSSIFLCYSLMGSSYKGKFIKSYAVLWKLSNLSISIKSNDNSYHRT